MHSFFAITALVLWAGNVCDRVTLALDEKHERAAVLELRDCHDRLLDQLTLIAPRASIDPKPLSGVTPTTWLVTVDLTQPMGSYNGPLTELVQAENGHLHRVEAVDEKGKSSPIQLATTGKAAWRQAKGPVFFAVRSGPSDDGFQTVFFTYRLRSSGWRLLSRTESGLWEADAPFPDAKHFRWRTSSTGVAAGDR